MKIVVTGGAGFVGSTLCLQLKNKYPNYEIVAFDNLKRRGSELNLIDFQKNAIAFIHGDIRNNEDLQSLGSFDVLIEASAEPSVTAGLDSDPTYVINNNLYGSINCFNTCVKNKAKLIFLSTSRVYPIDTIEKALFEEKETKFLFTEDQAFKGITSKGISEELSLEGARSFYGTTKLSSELFIHEYTAFYGLKAAITRFGVIAGPRQMGKTDQGVVTLWMAKHYWKQSLKYIGYGGKGKQVRDNIHSWDLVNMFWHFYQDPRQGEVYNAGGGRHSNCSMAEAIEMCEQITGKPMNYEYSETNRVGDHIWWISDVSKFKEHYPEWSWKYNINDILTQIYQATINKN